MAKGKLDSHPAKKRKYEDVVDNSNDRKRPKAVSSRGLFQNCAFIEVISK